MDDFGDRMKLYEQAEAGRHLMPRLPVIARLDGKSFHKWTEGLDRPYDLKMQQVMQSVTRAIIEETSALIGYTQSDEITMIYHSDSIYSQIYFNGKIQKMCSVLASMAGVHFNALAKPIWPEKKFAYFDCRIWNVPDKIEATNALLWREQDAAKNSISMAARAFFDHAEIFGKSGPEMQDMMFKKKGVNWNDYPADFKRGAFFAPRKIMCELDAATLIKIPEAHRPKPGVKFERTKILKISMPPFSKVTNRVDVVFAAAEPNILSAVSS